LSTDASRALELISSLLRFYLVLIIPVILLLALFADGILRLLFGAGYSNAGPVLMVLLAALPFLAINQSLLLLLRAIPNPRAVLTGQIVSTVVLLAAAAILIPRYGASGAAAALVASEAAGMLLLFWLVRRTIGAVPWNSRCFAPLLGGAIVTLVFLLMNGWPLFLSLPLAALLYVLVLWLMKSVSADELRSVPHVISAALRNDNPEQLP